VHIIDELTSSGQSSIEIEAAMVSGCNRRCRRRLPYQMKNKAKEKGTTGRLRSYENEAAG
jgi:hypothetical protein